MVTRRHTLYERLSLQRTVAEMLSHEGRAREIIVLKYSSTIQPPLLAAEFSLKPRRSRGCSRVTRTRFLIDIAKTRSSKDKGREVENELGDEVRADTYDIEKGVAVESGKISYRSETKE